MRGTRRRVVAAATAAALALTIGACGDDESNSDGAASAQTASGKFPVTVIDKSGTKVTVDQAVTKIACMSVTCVDIVAELGLSTTGVTDIGRKTAAEPAYFGPDKAKALGRIRGTLFAPNVEDVVSEQPDLVIGAAGRQDKFRSAIEARAPLYLVGPGPYTDTIKQLRDIAKLTGRETQAETAVSKLEARIAAYREASPNDVIPLIIYGSPKELGISTNTSVAGSTLAAVNPYPWKVPAGVEEDGAGDIPYSLERVLKDDPDVILSVTFPGDPSLTKGLTSNPLWSKLSAVKNKRVYEVDARAHTAQGTRAVGLSLDELMPLLYPEDIPAPLT